MDLGERIKNARLEAGLSQRQLCGETVTRNMLSLIESGKARPSMDTLRHFAQMLNKPLSWFLEEETVTSPNQAVMQKCEKAYADGDYSGVLALLEDYRAPDGLFDGVRYLLEVLACEALAQQTIAQGKRAYGLRLLDRAEEAGKKTPYAPGTGHRTLLRWQADPKTAATAKLSIDRELLFNSDKAMQAGDFARAAALLDAVEETSPQWHLLRGTSALKMGDAEAAVRYLREAEDAFPEQAVPLLEQAYLALGDYRHAYEYAKRGTK